MKFNCLLTIIILTLLSTNVFCQDFYDINTIQEISITFSQSNWDYMLDTSKAGSDGYIMAQSVTLNGTQYDSVGVKFKGNSTYSSQSKKNPFHIELDTYKDQDYQGFTDIKLSNSAKDPSFLREVLSYSILRQYMAAPLSNYANVSVNGTLIGLYISSESIGKKFVNKNFYSKDNAFFKCNPLDGAGPGSSALPNLVYLGTDSSSYYSAYEMKSDNGWGDLIKLCNTLKNNVSEIETVLNVDEALWMLAFDNILVNLDSYIGGFAQNYYLYKDNTGQFNCILWDFNESFGTFSQTGTINLQNTTSKMQMTHLLHSGDLSWPLVQKLLSVPTYKKMYLAHLRTILAENFANNSYYTLAQSIQPIIDAAVQADPNKFYTYAQYQSNLTTDINSGVGPNSSSTPGITNLMSGRNSYLSALADFTNTQPTITNVTPSDLNPTLNTTIFITANVINTNTDAVYLGYRDNIENHFIKILMYDDGSHGDATAGDNVYGASIDINNSTIQYYIYAENDNAASFSPARAAYEFYTLTVSGNLVINEFMASNETTVADFEGEYDDWIELYNNSETDIALSGYFLSDAADNLSQWAFPDTVILAKGYLIVWADNDETQLGLHSNFKLSGSGETIYLSNSDSAIINQVSYTEQTTDFSTGRYPNGTGSFVQMSPTFSLENIDGITSVEEQQLEVPIIYSLAQNYPNPFNPTTQITVSIPKSGVYTLRVYNVLGQEVAVLLDNQINAGTHTFNFDASNLTSGIYFYNFSGNNFTETKKMMLMK